MTRYAEPLGAVLLCAGFAVIIGAAVLVAVHAFAARVVRPQSRPARRRRLG